MKPNATFLAKYMTHAVVSVSSNVDGGCCGCDRIGIQLPMQSMHITTKVVSFNPAHGEV